MTMSALTEMLRLGVTARYRIVGGWRREHCQDRLTGRGLVDGDFSLDHVHQTLPDVARAEAGDEQAGEQATKADAG